MKVSDYITEAMNIPDDIPDENKNGNCYQAAFNKFMENPRKYTLVHGIVTGQGPISGIQYGHAWVEDGDTIIDMTLPPQMQRLPRPAYYAIGHIKITRRYGPDDVLEMLDEYGTYGPWDAVFDDYY